MLDLVLAGFFYLDVRSIEQNIGVINLQSQMPSDIRISDAF